MSIKYKISPIALKTPFRLSKKDNGIRETKEFIYYPLTPTVINKIPHTEIKLKAKQYLENIESAKEKVTITDHRLRDYQRLDASTMVLFKRIGLFNQQRLGKTPTVLSALKAIDDDFITLIIAPKSTHYQWEKEVHKWYEKPVERIRGPLNQRLKAYHKKSSVYITTYETAHKDFDYLLPMINCVVVDEAHRLRNFKGFHSKYSPSFTKSVVKLCTTSNYRFLLTGTPAPNYPYQIYPLLHILYPDIFSSYWGFVDYYFSKNEIYTKQGTVTVEGTFKNKEKERELQEFLNITCIQRKRKDYMKWLPKTDIHEIKLELDKKERKWYNELNETWECEELGYDCPNKLALMIRLRQITSTMSTKENYILDYIKDYPEEQIIITSTFSSYLKELQKKIPNSKLITGETTSKERGILEQSFNKKEYKILLGNTDVLKEGMKLEQGNTIIVINPSLTYSDNEQLYDRIVPTNQEVAESKEKQQVLLLIIPDTIDEYIQQKLDLKESSTSIINNFTIIKRKENKNEQ